MAHTIEPASSGRSKCRACGQLIAKDELRFGERLPNPFADGDMTVWFHITCAAMARPESFLEVVDEAPLEADTRATLAATARFGAAHRRLPRIAGAQRAPSGRARCRHCREVIAKDDWRIPLMFFEEGTFNRSGFVHVGCAAGYFETNDVLGRLEHFAPQLSAEDLDELGGLLGP